MKSDPQRIYFQNGRSVLLPAAAVAIVFLIVAGATLYVARRLDDWDVFRAGILLALIGIGIPVVFLRSLSRPMLTLHDELLIYRRTAIPWSRVIDAYPLQLGSMGVMGIKIADEDEPLVYFVRNESARNMLARKNSMLLHKYGALIVPAARGLSIPKLCERVNTFRANIVKNDDREPFS
jgi:hypothetical protein